MLELPLFGSLAGVIQFAVEVDAETTFRVTREGDVRPRLRRHCLLRDDDVARSVGNEDAEPAVMKVRVERARTGED